MINFILEASKEFLLCFYHLKQRLKVRQSRLPIQTFIVKKQELSRQLHCADSINL